MKDQFIKKYWEEENTLFYVHFHNSRAVRQVEVMPDKIVFLSSERPGAGDTTLYDQSIDDLELEEKDFISAAEFDEIWNTGEAGEVQMKKGSVS